MSLEHSPQDFDIAKPDPGYLRQRVKAEAEAAASAHSLAATMIHVELATAYAKRCRHADDQVVAAEIRLW